MRRFLHLSLCCLFILLGFYGLAQDLIITQKLDSIACTVTNRAKGVVYYEVQDGDETSTYSMSRSAIKKISYNYFTDKEQNTPKVIAIGGDTLTTTQGNAALKKNLSDSRMDSKFRVYGGYQIGGFTLAGFDVSYGNKIAIHAGGGVQGYTFGLRVFPIRNTDININLSYKDGGHGDIETIGAEVGAMIIPFDKNTGIYVQIGYANVLTVNERLSEELFDDEEAPFGIVSIGLGIRIY